MGRRAQEINVIVHYPTTYYGWLELMRRIASIDPERLYAAIKNAKCSRKNKDLLLQQAHEYVKKYQEDAFRSYERRNAFGKDGEWD